MAQANNLDFNIAMHTKGMEQIATLINRVDALEAATRKLETANSGLAKSTETVIQSGKRYNNALDAQSKALRNARQGSQMAMMQFQDFFTSVSTGADPVQAFNQQIGQLGYSMTMMQGNLGKFGRILSGPVGIGLIVATSLLGAFREQIFGTSEKSVDFAKTANDAFTSISKNIEESLQPALERLGPLIEILAAMWEMVKKAAVGTLEVIGWAINRILGATAGAINAVVILVSNSLSIVKELGAGTMNLFAQVANYVIDGVEKFINNTKGVANSFLEYIGSSFRFARTEFSRMSQTTNKWAGSTSKAFADVGSAFMKSFKSDIIDFGELDISWKAKEDKKKKGAKDTSSSDAAKKEAERLAKIEEANAIRNAKSKIFWAEYWSAREDEIFSNSVDASAKRAQEIGYIVQANAELIAQQVEEPLQRIDESFQTIGSSVSDAFKGMLTGAMSWKDGMRGIISSVIDELWRLYVVQQIVGFVTKALGGIGLPVPAAVPGKAVGGYVGAQQPYMVGEKGPELFIPGGSGTIIPNKNLGGGQSANGVTVNVDARGSADPAAVRAQVEQGILQAAPAIIAAAQQRTVNGLRRPKLGGVMQ